MYLQRNFQKHTHKYFVDLTTGDALCLCGKQQGTRGPATPKYGNVHTSYNEYTYDSGLEAEYAQQLDWLLKAKQIRGWRRQIPIALKGFNGDVVATYRMDFEVDENDGTKRWVETKGQETPLWRLKAKLLENQYERELRERTLVFEVVKRSGSKFYGRGIYKSSKPTLSTVGRRASLI